MAQPLVKRFFYEISIEMETVKQHQDEFATSRLAGFDISFMVLWSGAYRVSNGLDALKVPGLLEPPTELRFVIEQAQAAAVTIMFGHLPKMKTKTPPL